MTVTQKPEYFHCQDSRIYQTQPLGFLAPKFNYIERKTVELGSSITEDHSWLSSKSRGPVTLAEVSVIIEWLLEESTAKLHGFP